LETQILLWKPTSYYENQHSIMEAYRVRTTPI
jgi:hypothetical protein